MIRIIAPVNGAVLNARHGKAVNGGLLVDVRGRAPAAHAVLVNGQAARRAGDEFCASVVLTDLESDITAACSGAFGSLEHTVRVVWDRASFPRYRFSIDDCSFFLRDLAARRPRSLFEGGSFLPVLRTLHQRHGTKFALNLFFQTPGADFTLDRFPADWRSEWKDNADWLSLSFHAKAEFPDRPYQYADPATLAADLDQVAAEIQRFAGPACWSPPTVIHWGMAPRESLPLLARRGVRALTGFFVPYTGSQYVADSDSARAAGAAAEAPSVPTLPWDLNYLLDEERSEYLSRHDALKDFASGIVFSHGDLVCNTTPVDRVEPILGALAADPATAEVMDLFTHEQYFWSFYAGFRPDHAERCEAAIRFCAERGYKPVFFHEGLLGAL
jgi:hypothetical protein